MCPPAGAARKHDGASPHIRWSAFQDRFSVSGELQQRHPEIRSLVEAGDGEKAAFELGRIVGASNARQLVNRDSARRGKTLVTGGTTNEVAVASFLSQLAGDGILRQPVASSVHLPHTLVSKPWAVPIVITALPHVEPESVAANYSYARRLLLESFSGRISVRRIVMFKFIKEEEIRSNRKLTGSERLDRWNAVAPDAWAYRDRRTLSREFRHEMRTARNTYETNADGSLSRTYRGYSWEGDGFDEGDEPVEVDSFEDLPEIDDWEIPELR